MSTTIDRPAAQGSQTNTAHPPHAAGGGSASSPRQGPLPLILGVTGHRDLRPEDIPALHTKVNGIFDELASRCPQTPLQILSPLAEGADRLIARVALERGLRLIVALPMPREEYEKDFSTPESRAEFAELLNRADAVVEMPMMPGNDVAALADPAMRAEQYALVGAYLVRHCQVLIALWNGDRGRGGGGTADIVAWQETGIPERYRHALSEVEAMSPRGYLDPPESGPLYHILTPRVSDPRVVGGQPLALKTLFPEHDEGEEVEEDERSSTFDRILQEMNTYNIEVMALAADPGRREALAQSARYLLPDAEASTLPEALQMLRRRYAMADVLAIGYQKGTVSTLIRLCVVVFFAIFSFEVATKLFPDNGLLSLIFPALLLVAYGIYHSTLVKGKWQDHYQDYRALAEGLRVEFFWRLAGLPPAAAADHYLREQRTELDWIRIAVRNLSSSFADIDENPASSSAQSAPPRVERFDLVDRFWVRDQRKYFGKAAHRDEAAHEKIEKLVEKFVVVGPVIAALMGLALLIPSPLQHWLHGGADHHGPGYLFHKGLIILIFVLAATGGVLHTYADKRALAQQAKQYERMSTLFSVAERHLEEFLREGRIAEARQVILELGRASLAENGDWVLVHRERPVDVPHAG